MKNPSAKKVKKFFKFSPSLRDHKVAKQSPQFVEDRHVANAPRDDKKQPTPRYKIDSSLLKIGQAAKTLGVSIDTLRRWERAGKIEAIRTPGGTRLYSLSALKQVNPAVGSESLSTEELLRKASDRVSSPVTLERSDRVSLKDSISPSGFQNDREETQKNNLKRSLFTKFLIGSAFLSILTLLITTIITASYFTTPKATGQLFKNNLASGLLSPFNKLAETAVAIISPKKAIELGFAPPDKPPLNKTPEVSLSTSGVNKLNNSSVLAVTASSQFLEINSNTQINGSLDVRDAINGLTLEATPSAGTIALTSGTTSLTISNTTTLDQDVSTAASPTFNTLNLSATNNQLVFQSGGPTGTLTWTPTAARIITMPDATTTLVGINNTQTLTNKSISGSDNTLTNIPNSALTNNKVTVTAGTNLTGGGDVALGSSVTLALKDSPSISGTLTVGGVVSLSDGTAAAPSLSFTNDIDTGLYRIGANKIGLITGGTATSGITIDGTGNVGIGTITPTSALHVAGTGNITGNVTLGGTLDVTGNTGIGSSLTVTNVSALNGGLKVTGFSDLTGNVGIGGTATVTSLLSANGSATVTGSLCINGECKTSWTNSGNYTASNGITLSTADFQLGGSLSRATGIDISGQNFGFLGGNVGIGLTNPDYNFRVNGTGYFSGFVGIGSSLNVSGNVGIGTSLTVTNVSALNGGLKVTGFSDLTGNVGIGQSLNVSSAAILDSLSVTKSISAATIGTSGNVGIGGSLTVTSGANFSSSVNVVGNTQLSTLSTSGLLTASNGLTLTTGALNLTSTSGLANLALSSSTTAFTVNGLFGIDTQNNRIGIGTTAPQVALQVLGGNVGIGTSAAGAPLQVNGGGLFGWGTASLAGPANGLGISGNLGIGTTTANSNLSVAGNAHIGSLYQGTVAPTNGLFVDGSVGIGATAITSSNKLDVWGNARIAGTLTVDGDFNLGGSNSGAQFLANDGTALAPGYSFTNDADSGLWRIGNNQIALTTGGSAFSGLSINSSGNMGIGTTAAVQTFQVNSSGSSAVVVTSGGNIGIGTTSPTSPLEMAPTLTSGTIFNMAYPTTTTLTGSLTGWSLDLNSGKVLPNNNSVTGALITLPTTTTTSGSSTLKGLVVNFGSGAGVNNNSAGALTYTAADLSMPALTETQGTLTANGVLVTTPSSITTGGTANAINVSATAVGAGSLNAVNIGTITGLAGTETAVNVGTGWDSVLKVGSTTIINGSGVTQVAGGGTGIATYNIGDLLYASGATTFTNLGIGTSGQVLTTTTGVPTWSTINGSSCVTCLINNPTASSVNTVSPTGQATTGLSVRQTSTASPTQDIFNITDSTGVTKYFYVDSVGNVSSGSVSSQAITLTPTSDITALTLVGTNVLTSNLSYFNSRNTQGTIFNIAYGSSQTLTGTLTGQAIDFTNLGIGASNQSVTGEAITMPAVTNTNSSGTKTYTGLQVTTASGLNQNGAGATISNGVAVTIPPLTQTSGTITGNGLLVTTPSSITTGGIANGLNISASGIGAGTLYGINIGQISGGAGTETAINIGSGWDTLISNANFYVKGDGNLGIGTSSPTRALDVVGTGNISGNVGIGASLTTTGLTLANGGLQVTGLSNLTGNVGIGSSLTVTGLTYSSGGLRVNGFSDLTGNVGIGQSLTVTSGANFSSSVNVVGNTQLSTLSTSGLLTASNGFTLTTGALNLTSTSGLANLALSSSATAFTVNGLFGIDTQNNRIGIGTTAPQVALQVLGGNVGIGTSAAGAALQVNGGGLFGWGTASVAGPNNGLGIFGNIGIGTTTANNPLSVVGGASFGTYSQLTAPSNGIIVSGNVGIGWTSPQQALHLIGTMEIQPSVGSSQKGCLQFNATNADLEYSNDCTTYQSFGATAGGWSDQGTYTRLTTTSANVGIGIITAPAARVHLLGQGAGTGLTFLTQNSTQTNFGLAVLDNGNVGIGTTAPSQLFQINANGTSAFAVNSSGNVGIGFTSPNQALQVASAPSAATSLANILGANGSQLSLTGSTATTLLTKLAIGMDTTNNFGYLQAGQNGSASNLILEPSGGNVGIGTTVPSSNLEVYKSVTADGNHRIEQQNMLTIFSNLQENPYGTGGTDGRGFGASILFKGSYYDNSIANYGSIAALVTDTTAGHADLVFSTSLNTTSGVTEKMRLNYNGNLGIGAITSGAKLHVVGNAMIGYADNTTPASLSNGLAVSGNVGIGTTSPATLLQVGGSAAASSIIRTNINGAAYYGGFQTAISGTAKWFVGMDGAYNDLYFSYDGTGRASAAILINSSGNVGINTVTPGYKLDVSGSGNFTSLFVNGVSVGVGGSNYWTPATGGIQYGSNVGIGTGTPGAALDVVGNIRISTGGSFQLLNGSNNGTTVLYNSGATGVTNLTVRMLSTDLFTFNSSGNLGIGTTTPTAQLHIYGSTPYIYVDNSSSADSSAGGLAMFNGGTVKGRIVVAGGANGGITGLAAGDLAIRTANTKIGFSTDDGNTAAMMINGGNVGIGFTSPNVVLQVAGAPSAATSLANILGANGSQLSLTGNAAGTTLTKLAIGMDTTNNFGYLQAGQNGAASNLILEPNGGNVGIGTTSPAQKLDVYGNFKSTNTSVTSQYTLLASDGVYGYGANNTTIQSPTSYNLLLNPSGGNVGIGIAPTNFLDIAQAARSGDHNSTLALYVTSGMGTGQSLDGGVEFRHSNGTQGIGFGYNTIYAVGGNQSLNLTSRQAGNLTLNAYGSPTGNVGVGATSPAYKLDVWGTFNATSGVYSNGVLLSPGTGSNWSVSGGDIYRSSGNVGIGTATPAVQFDIVNSNTGGQGRMFIQGDTSILDFSAIGSAVAGTKYGLSNANLQYIESNSGNFLLSALGAYNLAFATNSNVRMMINSAGNVGIGWTSPNQLLEVNGAAAFGNSTTAGGVIVQKSGSIGLILGMNPAASAYNDLSIRAASSGNNQLYLSTGGNVLINQTAGNVGIGFTSPDRLLQISSDINITGTAASILGANGAQFSITGGTANTINKKLTLGLDTTDNYGVIQAGNTSGTSYDLALQPGGGNVGIGFTSPAHALDINGNLGLFSGKYINFGSADGTSGYGFYDNSGTLQFKNSGGTWASFSGSQWLTSGSNIGYLTGNVGIGTTAPAQALQVVGTMQMTQNSSSGCLRYNSSTLQLQWSNDCLAYQAFSAPAAGGWTYDSINNIARLTTNSTNVGIGFTSPDRKLQLSNDIDITGTIASLLGTNGTQFAITGSTGSGTTEKKLVLGIDTTDNYGVIQAGNTSGTAYNLALQPAGGNVGIGFTSPNALFTVGATNQFQVNSSGAIAAVTGITTSGGYTQTGSSANTLSGALTLSANNAALSFTGSTPSITSGGSVLGLFAGGNVGIGTTGNLYGGLTVRGAGTGTNITLQTYGSNLTQGLTVLDNGNVGIGETSPTRARLESRLDGAGEQVALALINKQTSGGVSTQQVSIKAFFDYTSGTGYGEGSKIVFGKDDVYDNNNTATIDSNLAFYTVLSNGTSAERMRISSGGNVGIGTTSPSQLFQINYSSANPLVFTSGGNLGVGTASPTQKLQVVGALNLAGNESNTLSLDTSTNVESNYLLTTPSGYAGIRQDTAHSLNFDVYNSNSEKAALTIQQSGNVGIGFTSPDQPLYVNGSARLTGALIMTPGQYFSFSPGAATGANSQAWISKPDGGNMRFDTRDATGIDFYTNATAPAALSIASTQTVTIPNLGTGANYYVCASATGLLSEATSCSGSSIRFKENVEDLNLGLDALKQLRPVTYKWKGDYRPEDQSPQLGFIAEEVEQINPMFVFYKDGQIQGVKYDQITALLTKAIQEQQGEILNLQTNQATTSAALAPLQAKLANLSLDSNGNLTQTGNFNATGKISSGVGLDSPYVHSNEVKTGKLQIIGDTGQLLNIGSSTASILTVNSNGNVQMQGTLNVAGNIGIGTTSPTAALDVIGNVNVSGKISTPLLDLGSATISSSSAGLAIQFASDSMAGSPTTFQIKNSLGQNLFSVDASGSAKLAGTITTGAGAFDVAEIYKAKDDVEAGDVVSISPVILEGATRPIGSDNKDSIATPSAALQNDNSMVEKSQKPYDSTIIGIISTNPGLTLSSDTLDGKPVALNGRVPVKVSTENGPINIGDYLTSSSTPGVAMKATKPGQVVGKALESFDGTDCRVADAPRNDVIASGAKQSQCKIMAFVNVTFADPGNFLASLSMDDQGNLIVPKLKAGSITLDPTLNSAPVKLTSTSEAATQNTSKVGFDSFEVSAKIASLEERIANLENVILEGATRPIGSDSIATPSASLQNDSTALTQVATNSAQVTGDSGQQATPSASVSNCTLYPETCTLNLTPPDILLATSSASLYPVPYTLNPISDATVSGLLTAYNLNVQEGLKSLGKTTLADTLIAGDLTVDGTMSVTGSSINSISCHAGGSTATDSILDSIASLQNDNCGTLYLQNSPLAGLVDFFNGQVTIDNKGSLIAQTVSAKNIVTNKLTISNAPIASGSATLAASIGTATILAGQTEIPINTNALTVNSKVFLTATSPTGGQALTVSYQETNIGFIVTLDHAYAQDIKFNWWIVETN